MTAPFLSGMPVAMAELKDTGKQDGLPLGVDQIRRYHRETPEMFVATQVFEVTQLLDFFYGVTWSTSRRQAPKFWSVRMTLI